MAPDTQGINIFRLLLLVLPVLPLIRTTNIDCNGKAFHCVNSTHFMICVDIGRGLSSTVDDFVIPCPMTTECRVTNRFECEYPPRPSSTTTAPTTTQVIDFVSTVQQMKTTMLQESSHADYQITTSPHEVINYISSTGPSFIEGSVITDPIDTNIITEPSTARETLENNSEKNSKYSVNTEENFELSTTVPNNYTDVLTTVDPVSTISTPDITTTESVTQVDTTVVYIDPAQYDTTVIETTSVQSSTDFTTENIVDVKQDVSSGNIGLTTDIGDSLNTLGFTVNGYFNPTTVAANEIYTSTEATSTNTNEIVHHTENIMYTTKDDVLNSDSNTITTESIILSSDNIFSADNTEATTESRTTIFDIQDTYSSSPKSANPTDSTIVNALDSPTDSINYSSSDFTTELVPTQDLKVSLTSYVVAETTESGSIMNTRGNLNSFYKSTQIQTEPTRSDPEINNVVTESFPLNLSDSLSGTYIHDALMTTLDTSHTERGNSDVYDLNTDYTNSPLPTTSFQPYVNYRFEQNTDYTTQTNGDLTKIIEESTQISTTYISDQELQATGGILDASTSYSIDFSDKDLKKTMNSVTAPTIYLQDYSNSNTDLFSTTSDSQIYDISTKQDQDATTLFNIPPREDNKVERITDLLHQGKNDLNVHNTSSSKTLENLTLADSVRFPQKSVEYNPDRSIASESNITTENTTDFINSLSFDETSTKLVNKILRTKKLEQDETRKNIISYEKNVLEASTTGTTLLTTSLTVETTIQESLTESVTETITTKMEHLPNPKFTTLIEEREQIATVTENAISTLSFNNGETIPATAYTQLITTQAYDGDNMGDKVFNTTFSAYEDLPPITQSTIYDYFQYDTVSLPNNKLLTNEMRTTTIDTNAIKDIDNNSKKLVQDRRQDMASDLESDYVSTTVLYNPQVQIDQAAHDTIILSTAETTIGNDVNFGHTESYTFQDTLSVGSKDGKSYDENMISNAILHNTLATTKDFTTSPTTIQSKIRDYTKYDMMTSVNYESTANIDIDMNVSEYLNHVRTTTTESNAEDNANTNSTENISTSKLQDEEGLTSGFNKGPGDPDVQVERVTDNTIAVTTDISINEYDVELGYTEKNIYKDAYPSESTLPQATNIDKKILSSFIVITDKPETNIVIGTTASLDSIQSTHMETPASATNSWKNRYFQNTNINLSTTSFTTLRYESINRAKLATDFTAGIKEIEMAQNNFDFSTEKSNELQRNGTKSNSTKYYDTVGLTQNNVNITNNYTLVSENNNFTINNSNNPSESILKENITQGTNSVLQTNVTLAPKDGKSYSTFKSIDEAQRDTASSKNISTNMDIIKENVTQTKINEVQSDYLVLDIGENKNASGNIYPDKVDSNVGYNQIFDTITTLTVPGVVLTPTPYETVKTNTEIITETRGESQHHNPPLNIQNTTYKVNASDDKHQNDNTNSWTNETNTLTKYALSNQTTEASNGVRNNKANNSYLHNDQTIKPNFDCLYRYRGRYADNENCRKFYICIGKHYPIIGMCPVNTVFSDLRKQCTRNLSHCVRNYVFYCTSDGRFRDIFNNNIYYICIKNPQNKFVRYKLQCENGYHLNKDTIQCISDVSNSQSTSDSDNSEGSADTSVSTTNSNESRKGEHNINFFKCENEGKFPDPNHCRKYYVCSKNKQTFKRKLKSCDSDEVFDKDKKKCVDADSDEC